MGSIENQFNSFIKSKSILIKPINTSYSLFKLNEYFKPISPVESNNVRFGKRMEDFFLGYINDSKQYECLLHNFQVVDKKITIGEIDFILKDLVSNKKIHVELAYKFYLLDPNLSNNQDECWVGPNKNDSLIKKLIKFQEKQLPLINHPATKKVLLKKNITDKIDQQICLLGKLYTPYQSIIKVTTINSNCLDGFWLSFNEFKSKQGLWCGFYIPNKELWHTNAEEHNTWFSFNEISDYLNQHIITKKSPMVWVKNKKETLKLFIVFW